MSADEFLKKWGFLPPIKYARSRYHIQAYYGSHIIIRSLNDLDHLFQYIDETLEGLNK